MRRTGFVVAVAVIAAVMLAAYTMAAEGGAAPAKAAPAAKGAMMKMEPYDPVSILACKDELGLTDEQVKKIQDITMKARTDVEALLTPAQKQAMQGLAPGLMLHKGERVEVPPMTPEEVKQWRAGMAKAEELRKQAAEKAGAAAPAK